MIYLLLILLLFLIKLNHMMDIAIKSIILQNYLL